jgi:hypothetical protein
MCTYGLWGAAADPRLGGAVDTTEAVTHSRARARTHNLTIEHTHTHTHAHGQVLQEQLPRRAGPGGEALVPSIAHAQADLQERLIYRCVCVCVCVCVWVGVCVCGWVCGWVRVWGGVAARRALCRAPEPKQALFLYWCLLLQPTALMPHDPSTPPPPTHTHTRTHTGRTPSSGTPSSASSPPHRTWPTPASLKQQQQQQQQQREQQQRKQQQQQGTAAARLRALLPAMATATRRALLPQTAMKQRSRRCACVMSLVRPVLCRPP